MLVCVCGAGTTSDSAFLYTTVDELLTRNIGLKVLAEAGVGAQIDTTTAKGRLLFWDFCGTGGIRAGILRQVHACRACFGKTAWSSTRATKKNGSLNFGNGHDCVGQSISTRRQCRQTARYHDHNALYVCQWQWNTKGGGTKAAGQGVTEISAVCDSNPRNREF